VHSSRILSKHQVKAAILKILLLEVLDFDFDCCSLSSPWLAASVSVTAISQTKLWSCWIFITGIIDIIYFGESNFQKLASYTKHNI